MPTNFRSFVAMPKRLFDNLGQSRNICQVKFALREKLSLTNTSSTIGIDRSLMLLILTEVKNIGKGPMALTFVQRLI